MKLRYLLTRLSAMDTLLSFPTTAITGFLAFLLFLYSMLWLSRRAQRNSSNKKMVPEPGGAWPLIGHLHLLRGPKPSHVTLGNMADKYGPIFMIKMGMHRVLIVSNWEIAKECFTTNDKIFCNRPKALAPELMGYNYAMFGFSPYGPYWRQIRKITMLEILSNHRLEMLKYVRESEVKTSIKELYDLWVKNKGSSDNKVLVEMKRWFGKVTLNVISRMVVGKVFLGASTNLEESEKNDRSMEALREFFELSGAFALADAIPFTRWLDIGGHEKAMKKTAKELDQLIEGWLKEHKHKRSIGEIKDEHDFMSMMLPLLDEAQELPSYDADTIIKATCLGMILAGTDTSTVTMTWALALLLNNRHVLERAQNELDTHVGRERQVQESDIKNLVSIQAIVKETLRLYPAAPLSVPHESLEDCSIGGYHVPAGTRLLVNLSKIHRDPKVWCSPCEFQPERFLTTHKDVDVRGKSFELLPFGAGRRVCPGISFALQVMQFTLANLLHGFDFGTPGDGAIDMAEGNGLTNLKATPLEVLLSPRLPAHIYE